MQTVMLRGIILSYLLCSGLGAVAHAAEQTIARTVEHFTLGMPQDEAFAVLLAGLKQQQLTLVDQAQTPLPELIERVEHPPMDAGRPPWLVPQSADILYTLNAFLFDVPEFKDPVVNIALAAQVEQSLAWSSPTAQSMYLVLYQSHVLGIFILPLAAYESTKSDCVTKYGPAQASIYHKSYGFAFVQGDQWSDAQTILTLTVDNGLFYVDRALYTRLQEEAAGMLKGVP
jgi:hypothetical protein